MAQQVQPPKEFLKSQALLPRQALGQTPLSALGEGLSGILSSVAGSLPDVPAPPGAEAVTKAAGAPGVPPGPRALGFPSITGVFKNIEASFPAGFPKVSQVVQSLEVGGGGNSAEAGPIIGGGFRSAAGAKKTTRIMGGGYRSI